MQGRIELLLGEAAQTRIGMRRTRYAIANHQDPRGHGEGCGWTPTPTIHEEAVKLMQSLDRKTTDKVLEAGLDYLKRPGRKIATIGFSMGGLESLNANLNDPEDVSATVMIYGSGFDKVDTKRLEKLMSPILVIAGGDVTNATQAAVDYPA